MRISIRSTYGVSDVRTGTTRDMETARDAGYEALELCVMGGETPRGWADALTPADIDHLLAEGERTGVPITSLSSDWVWGYTKDGRALSDWEDGVAGLAKDAELARQLGAGYILCHLGTSEGTWEEGREILRRAGDAAAENGVLFGFEASLFRRSNLGEFDDLLRMLDELDHPAMGAYDHCHYPRMGKPAHVQVEQIGKRLYGYHSSLLTPETTDYGKLFDALEAVDYRGDWVFEIEWKHADAQCALMRKLLADNA
jgi:sugar phosphate isomerase/epimerase